jgi:hypothetical protein
MAKPKSKRLLALEAIWLARYGGPHPISVGAILLAKILREMAAKENGQCR